MSRQEKTVATEPSGAQLKQDEVSTAQALDSMKKPFVEPSVSVPLDVLEATSFFQGSGAIAGGTTP